ncbi:MAG: serine protein kinase RIO [Crenarchaeota archaeon]|nr:MAG: serine protein kinase RIO [Thermoproteota archaeon]
MSDDLDRKLESKIEKILIDKQHRGKIFDGFDKNKTLNDVLDKPTMMTLYDMINDEIISYVIGVVKAGKESVVFWAVDKNKNDVALKVYLVSTSNFKKRSQYLVGDPRFSRIKKGTRNIVYLWARKEFTNLSQCYEKNIPVVKPIHVSKNVLAMEFMGKNGVPERRLLESEIEYSDYEESIELIRRFYQDANLVHGDFSEYNIFKTSNGLVAFDLGSAVDIEHPNSKAFLERDINNITKFFVRRGLTIPNPLDVINEVTK